MNRRAARNRHRPNEIVPKWVTEGQYLIIEASQTASTLFVSGAALERAPRKRRKKHIKRS